MPNYGLVVTPTYNPMSYEQYVQPFKDYAQVYNETANQIDELEMAANQWEKLADSAIDQPQYQTYKNYADDIRAYAEELATKGLSGRTRAGLSRMRKRYASDIKPIEDAYTIREEERKMQTQARLQHPDIMFNREAATTGLSAYMAGTPELKTYSGEMLAKYTAAAASNLAREAREDLIRNGRGSGWYKILGDQYYEKAIRTGLTADEVMSAMVDPVTGRIKEGANPYLGRILEGAIKQSGMMDWENWNEVGPRALEYASTGLWNAIGQTDYKDLVNKEWDLLHSGRGDEDNSVLKYWDWLGSEISINGEDSYKENVETLNKIQEYLNEWEAVADDESKIYSLMMTDIDKWDWARKLASERFGYTGDDVLPDTNNNDRLTYASDMVNFLRKLYLSQRDYTDSMAQINKWTVLNNAKSTRLMRYVGNQITSGYNDEQLSNVVSGTDIPTARKILSSDDTTLQVNFNQDENNVRLNNPSLGTLYFDKSALHNLNIPLSADAYVPEDIKKELGISNGPSIIPADEYIDRVVRVQKHMIRKGYGIENIKYIMTGLIENFYNNVEANNRNLMPEPSVTGGK